MEPIDAMNRDVEEMEAAIEQRLNNWTRCIKKCNNQHNHGTIMESETGSAVYNGRGKYESHNRECGVDVMNGDGEEVDAVMEEILDERVSIDKCNNPLNCGIVSWMLRP